jgi:uncharacterized protein (DUF1697 family)
MSKIIALLRAINVGGTGKVAIADLRKLITDLGFADVASYIASGNLVFSGDGREPGELEALLQAEAGRRLGLNSDWILRRPEDWRAMATLGEDLTLIGDALYICFPEGAGTSKLAGAVIEKRLGARGTARNWNTVLKLAEMAGV